MAQFAGKRGTGWLWIVLLFVVILAVAALLILNNPEFSSMIPGY